ncbi:MmgE/PrpD family protein [Thalassospiraceae bacterium LMO-JJ14]|nr:MmgE/PrpD family protein [Thalassospiraceae bacterium LMO-JJ14]
MDGLNTTEAGAVLALLAEHIIGFDPSKITPGALHTAKAGIADTIGVTLAGLPEPCTQILLSTPGIGDAAGPCLILGTDRRTSALDATLINGVASHALDFDDFSDVLGGHQSVPLVPVLFALAEQHGLSGRALIDAYVVGFEVEHRFAMALHPHHYDKGWHPTATLGIFGTVAAAAYALKFDADQTTRALAIAASLASGIKANFGTMTKPLHVGHAGRAGLMAALIAERGFEANARAMEHHQGFFNVFNGEGTFNPAPLTSAWTEPLTIELPSIGIKQFPCCGSTHHAISAMLSLVKDDGVTAAQVSAIDIHVHPRRLRHTNTPFPNSVLQAKFSQQYAVARALKDGAVRLKDFEDDAFLDPAIVDLLKITRASEFREGGTPNGGTWDAKVSVTLKDGRTLTRRIDNMVGRSGDNAMSRDELHDKFSDCAARAIGEAAADTAFEALMDLENRNDFSAVTASLSAG